MSGYGMGDDREEKAAARNRAAGRRSAEKIIAEKDAEIVALKMKLTEAENRAEMYVGRV